MAVDKWGTAVAKKGERAIVFRFVEDLGPGFDRSAQPDRIIVQWPYFQESGMPTTGERERMDQFEDLLAPVIENDGLSTLALVSTGENLREWICYTKSEREFLARLNSALRKYPPFPVKILTARDPAWSSYQKFKDGLKR